MKKTLLLAICTLLTACTLRTTSVNTQTKELGNWVVAEQKDEFDTPTGKKYVYIEINDGKFSNSATRGSDLTARIEIGRNGIDFYFYEYGQQRVSEDLELVIKNSKGEIAEVNLKYGVGRHYILNIKVDSEIKRYYTIIKPLLLGGKVMFYGYNESFESEYSFTIPNSDELQATLTEAGINWEATN